MTTVTKDLIDGASIAPTSKGFEQTRVLMPENVGGSGVAQLYNALTDGKVPTMRTPHPVIPGIQVINRGAFSEDDGLVRVEVVYSVPDEGDEIVVGLPGAEEGGIISVGSAISSEETNFDVDGSPLLVTFTGTIEDSNGNLVAVDGEEQIATVGVQRPQSIVRFSRRETGSPLIKSIDFVGRRQKLLDIDGPLRRSPRPLFATLKRDYYWREAVTPLTLSKRVHRMKREFLTLLDAVDSLGAAV